MFPVMTEAGTVEIPLLERIAKVPAVPRFTGKPGSTVVPVVKVQERCWPSATPAALLAPVVTVAV